MIPAETHAVGQFILNIPVPFRRIQLTKAHSFGGQHSQDGASPATAAKYLPLVSFPFHQTLNL
jgi:hypothetical protein